MNLHSEGRLHLASSDMKLVACSGFRRSISYECIVQLM